MNVDDFVRTGTDAAKAASDLASNESTDAVNSGIVGSADKSGMMIKDPLYGSTRTSASLNDLDPFANDFSSASAQAAQQRLQSKAAVTMGSAAQQKADSLVSSASVTKKAASMLKQTGGKIAADRLVSSKIDKKKLLSKDNLKKVVKGAVVSETLRDTEFEGTDKYYYTTKNAWKLGRKGISAVKRKAAKRAAKKAAQDVTGGASKATKLLESGSKKASPRDLQKKTQALRNQRRVFASAQTQKAGAAGFGKGGAAKGGAALAKAGSGLGAVFGGIGSVFAPILIVVAGVLFTALLIAAMGSQNNNTGVGTLTGVPAEIASTLQGYGFSNEAIAAFLGNVSAESGDYNDIRAGSDGGDGVGPGGGTVSLGIVQMIGAERTNFLNWCVKHGKKWNTVASQMEWIFSGEPDTRGFDECGYWAELGKRWGIVRGGAQHYEREPGWQARFRTDYYKNPEDFKTSNDVDLATFTWMACYERCKAYGYSHLDKRLDFARRYLAELNASTSSGGTAPANANETVKRAYAELGKPYKWATVGPSTYDCSGLVSYCLTGSHTRLGSTGTFMGWPRVSDPQPGDICVNSHHCGIYIGNGQMIHSPQTEDVVKISNVHKDMIYVRWPG